MERGRAARFFATRLGEEGDALWVEPVAGTPERSEGPGSRAIASDARAARRCTARPRDDMDLADAERADQGAGFTGLALLARRCGYVWIVECEGEDLAAAARDRAALLIAAIVAGVGLGPILSPDRRELFGVKTARAKLESITAAAARGPESGA
jgi:hypothetical protein